MLQPSPARVAEHAQIQVITDEWVAAGNDIKVIPTRISQLGYSFHDWQRLLRGLKVASKEDVKAERDRRLLRAIKRNDVELVTRLASGKFDAQIKLDIEGGRINPATGAHLPLNNGGEVR